MKTRPVFPLLTSSLLLLSGGCGFFPFPGGNDTAQSPELPTPGQAPEAPPPVPVPQSTPLPDVDMSSLGLIPPVTPDQRRKEIDKGRTNPFTLIPITARVTTSPSPDGTEKMIDTDGDGKPDKVVPLTNEEKEKQRQKQTDALCRFDDSVRVKRQNEQVINIPGRESERFNYDLLPNEAREVVVSGIGVIGQTPFAIVKAPGEATSRSVREGDFLSRGSIRVSGINSLNRIVALEQYGQPVLRGVGEPPLPPLTPPEPKDTGTEGETIFIRSVGTGFGEIRNLVVLTVGVSPTGIFGRLCNTGEKIIKVQSLTFQLEELDEQKKGVILDAQTFEFPEARRVGGKQQLEFRSNNRLDFLGRKPEQVSLKFVDWD